MEKKFYFRDEYDGYNLYDSEGKDILLGVFLK